MRELREILLCNITASTDDGLMELRTDYLKNPTRCVGQMLEAMQHAPTIIHERA